MRESEEHRLHAEPLFRYLLGVEARRARRAGRPVLVLLVERAESNPSEPCANGSPVPGRAPGADGANGHGPPGATVPTAPARASGRDEPASVGASNGSAAAPRERRRGDGGPREDDPALMPPALAGRLAAALAGCLRETDLLGWYAEGHTLGAILTEVAADPAAWRVVVEKARRALRRALPAATPNPLGLGLYRADGEPPLRLVLTVPDVRHGAVAEVAAGAGSPGSSSPEAGAKGLGGAGTLAPVAPPTGGRPASLAVGPAGARGPHGRAGEGATDPAGARPAAAEAPG